MVTTFLTELDYKASARNLDRLRLGKQRTEAWQIWLVHRDLQILARYLNLIEHPPSHSDPIQYFLGAQVWADQIITLYKQQSFLVALEPPFLTSIPKTEAPLYKSVSASTPYLIEDDQVRIGTGKKQIWWPRSQTFLAAEGERLIKLGFINHPASRMWLGYSESLLEYLNAHIEVWAEQGYNNVTLSVIPVSNPKKPFWVNSTLIENHRGVLYGKDPQFYQEWATDQTEYIWPSQLSAEQLQQL